MDRAKTRLRDRKNRARRVRKKIQGTSERPRLCVHRTLKHISGQVFDDETGKSVIQLGTSSKEMAERLASSEKMTKSEASRLVGEQLAEMAKEKGVEKVVFDRRGYPYSGRVKALAEGARAKGLVF